MLLNSEVTSGVVSDLLAINEQERKLKAAKRALRAAEKIRGLELATKAANPQYQVGSRRRATAEEFAVLKKTVVCVVECVECGDERVVGVQDARQTTLCQACKAKADKINESLKRANRRLAGKSKEQLEQEIAATQAQLETLKAAVG